MRWIDEVKQKYRTVKKDGEYYLLTEHCSDNKSKNLYYKIEVTGKKNALKYIENNHLKKYEEEREWYYED